MDGDDSGSEGADIGGGGRGHRRRLGWGGGGGEKRGSAVELAASWRRRGRKTRTVSAVSHGAGCEFAVNWSVPAAAPVAQAPPWAHVHMTGLLHLAPLAVGPLELHDERGVG